MKVKKGTHFSEDDCMLLWIAKGWGSRNKKDNDYMERFILWLSEQYICANIYDIHKILLQKILKFWMTHFKDSPDFLDKMSGVILTDMNPFSSRSRIFDVKSEDSLDFYKNTAMSFLSGIGGLSMQHEENGTYTDSFTYEIDHLSFAKKLRGMRADAYGARSVYREYVDNHPQKYYYDTDDISCCTEECQVCDGKKIGSIACKKCENMIEHSVENSPFEGKKSGWIICKKINEAVGEMK